MFPVDETAVSSPKCIPVGIFHKSVFCLFKYFAFFVLMNSLGGLKQTYFLYPVTELNNRLLPFSDFSVMSFESVLFSFLLTFNFYVNCPRSGLVIRLVWFTSVCKIRGN